jgi:PII-like signaling protein
MLPENGYLLRLIVGERDRHAGHSLHEWILRQAKDRGLSGATVIRAMSGFGAHSSIHTAKILEISVDLPIIIEIVDQLEKIEDFLSYIDPYIEGGLATVEKVHIRLYRPRKNESK